MVRLGLRIKAGSISSLVPNPEHSGQAPCGELKEKLRGSKAGKLMPQSGQANNLEYVFSFSCLPDCFVVLFHQEAYRMKGGRLYKKFVEYISSQDYETQLCIDAAKSIKERKK